MGDNREVSKDSRSFGLIDKDQIVERYRSDIGLSVNLNLTLIQITLKIKYQSTLEISIHAFKNRNLFLFFLEDTPV